MGLSESDVARILKLVDESQFDEVRVEFADLKIHLRRSPAGPAAPSQPRAAEIPAAPAPAIEAAQEPAAPLDALIAQGCAVVRSPMVGTFYRAESPGAPPFVEIGARVEPEDSVCLVEVMKLFNTVKAGTQGTVRAILVADGEVVEYGQPLVVIDPSR